MWSSKRSPGRSGPPPPTAAARKPAGSTNAPAASTPTQLARERTPARQRAFKTLHPLRQKFTKADAAKFEHSWNQLPHIVSRGAEKNFRDFMIRLGETGPVIGTSYCQHLIAKAILFRATEKIVSAHQFGGYRANIVTYTIAKLTHETGHRLDLDRIWRDQRLGPALTEAISDLSVPVQQAITRPLRGANISEWAKRSECWARVIEIDWHIPAALRAELLDPPAEAGPDREDDASSPKGGQTLIAAVNAIPAEDWFAVARWAKETQNLQPWQRQIAFTIGQYLSKGWEISAKQAQQAWRIIDEAQRLGFQGSRRDQ